MVCRLSLLGSGVAIWSEPSRDLGILKNSEMSYVDFREHRVLDALSTAKRFDGTVISLKDDDEVRYWATTFGVTHERLQKLVNEHGASPRRVRAFLNITRDLPKAPPR